MFVSRHCGLSLIILLKTRLNNFTLVFLRAQFLIFLLCLSSNSQVFADQDYVNSENQLLPLVVVSSSVSEKSISLKKLRAIFAMKLRFWEEDKPITVFVLAKDNATHAAFCKRILNIFPNQLESVWYRQVYTGTGQAPIEVTSEFELIERVKNTSGSIGYIKNNNENKKRFSDEIKLLNIE